MTHSLASSKSEDGIFGRVKSFVHRIPALRRIRGGPVEEIAEKREFDKAEIRDGSSTPLLHS